MKKRTQHNFLFKQLARLFLAFLFFTITGKAQAPNGFTYQAVVRNANGELVANTLVDVNISILQGSMSGAEVFEESHTTITNANGLFTLIVGNGNPLVADLSLVDWSSGPYFIESYIVIDGDEANPILGGTQLLSVPYALYAQNSANDGADGIDGTDGDSAYQIWLNAGNSGTEMDFLNSLVGETGPQGPPGTSEIVQEQIVIVANEGQTQFNTPAPIDDSGKIEVYRNGIRIAFTTIDANTIELESTIICYQNDSIRIVQIL